MASQTTAVDPRLLRSLEDVGRFGYEAIKLYKSNANVDLTITPYDRVKIAKNKRFLVLHCIQDTNPKLPKEVIYKAWVDGTDICNSASNEIVFLSQFVPLLLKRLPAHIRHKIAFPSFLVSGSHLSEGQGKVQTSVPEGSFSLREYLNGKPTGAINSVKTGALTMSDIDTLAEVVHAINSFTMEDLIKANIDFKNFELGYNFNTYKLYLKEMNLRMSQARPILGDKVFDSLMEDLPKLKDWISSRPRVLISGDMNPSNIIKMSNGLLGLIDYERIGLGNIGVDHAFIIAWLYKYPQLRKHYLQKTLKLNPQDTDLLERIRIEYIYQRGIGELNTWASLLGRAKTDEERAQCTEAVNLFKDQILEAINRGGIWKTV